MSGNEAIESKLNSIEEAILDIRQGKVVIVIDDENRENEGDFIAAAQFATPDLVNFLITNGRGLVCVLITEARSQDLQLPLMVPERNALEDTKFTITVDFLDSNSKTGVSTSDRSNTIQALANPAIKADQFSRPGHIFPIIASHGGVLTRPGHTEAAVDLARLAGCGDTGVLSEILNADGSMARLPQLLEIAAKFDLKIISIADLIKYRVEKGI